MSIYRKNFRYGAFILIITALFLPTRTLAGPPVRDLNYFLKNLYTLDHLPVLENSHTAMASTWDRKGGNYDNADFKRIENGRNILLDTDGPGCIHRIFVGIVDKQHHSKTRFQVFIDHQSEPQIDYALTELFVPENGPIPYPLAFIKSYPGLLFPIPFEKHVLVCLTHPDAEKPDFDPFAWSNYWQVTYTRYEESVKVKSLSWPLSDEEKQQLKTTCDAWLKAESTSPPVPESWTIDKKYANITPGNAKTITHPGVGVIRQIRLGVDPDTPQILENLRLRIYWDQSANASVDVPVGYFFGHVHSGHNQTFTSPAAVMEKLPSANVIPYSGNFNSLLIGVTDTEAYCRIPMPFEKGMVLELDNHAKETIKDLTIKLDIESHDALPDNLGRFHTTWHAERAATPATPKAGLLNVPLMVTLQRNTRGKYIGTLLHVNWTDPLDWWWGEGDWLVWTDDPSWPPAYHGTGSEEYFNSGWGRFDRKAISGFAKVRPGPVVVYSFHLNDAFQFRHYIRFAEEQMGAGKGEPYIHTEHPFWATTAYWYALPAQPADSTSAEIVRKLLSEKF
ncbi:MAG: DUF2961 domain-containing protein [Sedimentisphaerales bacterium]|nr:DUF2961 domain-containing protein [Sedimentisphaerales bacterium]